MKLPPSLSELQGWMAQLLVNPQSLERSPEFTRQANEHIAGNSRLSGVEQLEIYREQFWLRHTAALLEDFPGLSRLLGQERWQTVVEGYLAMHPPTSATLRDLGHALPVYVRGLEMLEDRELLADMTDLEWAYVESFDAPDAAPLDRQRLTQLSEEDWERGVLVLAPSLRVLELQHAVADLRRALLAEEKATPELRPRASTFSVVHRRENGSVWDHTVSPVAAGLLVAFSGGMSLVTACEAQIAALPGAEAELEVQLTNWFSTWGKLGWIVGFETRSDPGSTSG